MIYMPTSIKFSVVDVMDEHLHNFVEVVPLDMKGCICHFTKWTIHPFISEGTISVGLLQKHINIY